MSVYFSPSLMCMDFLNIGEQINILNSRCDFYHIDIMDGHYVPNLTLSPDFVRAVSSVAKRPLDCHLMVTNPSDYIAPLKAAGASYICLQTETISANAFRLINTIKSCGCKVGAVFNPATPLSAAQYYLHLLDKITIMTVDPGFAGQTFIREMITKIEQARSLKEKNGYGYIIEIDGSCNEKTFGELYRAGAECFVVGSSGLFSLDSDLEKAWDKMKNNFRNSTEE
ncbi:MAG: ribulose-phosphate 3-epimerase [Clostridia bacterium]|nr:ribulose-phosphate 3-epimerase [Clostridia bacterium]